MEIRNVHAKSVLGQIKSPPPGVVDATAKCDGGTLEGHHHDTSGVQF